MVEEFSLLSLLGHTDESYRPAPLAATALRVARDYIAKEQMERVLQRSKYDVICDRPRPILMFWNGRSPVYTDPRYRY